MKIPKVIKIKKSLHAKLQKQRARLSKVYLLGADVKGVVTQAIRLRADSYRGCEYMRGIDANTMTQAYMTIIKKHCTPVGFANSMDFSYLSWGRSLRGWNWMMGGSINRYPGMIFVLYDKDVFAMTSGNNRRRYRVKIQIV